MPPPKKTYNSGYVPDTAQSIKPTRFGLCECIRPSPDAAKTIQFSTNCQRANPTGGCTDQLQVDYTVVRSRRIRPTTCTVGVASAPTIYTVNPTRSFHRHQERRIWSCQHSVITSHYGSVSITIETIDGATTLSRVNLFWDIYCNTTGSDS